MAYVPSSDVPSAFLISTDADAVLLDLLGTFVLLDGGSEKVSFTKHVRQIDANVISAPTKAALTNAVELNKGTVVPLVGNFPNVKSAGSEDSVAALLKRIEREAEGRPAITKTVFHPKYEPIVISKSLRSGRLELIVLAGEPKDIEILQKAVETGDENIIEKAASNHGTISVLVWFPAKATDPIKRVLHTGTAPLTRIVSALEKAKALPYLHSPIVSAANAYKEVPPPKAVSAKPVAASRAVPTKPINNATAPKMAAAKRPAAPIAAHPPPARPATNNSARSAPSKPSPARPTATATARTRPVNSAATAKPSTPIGRTSATAANKKANNHEAPIQKTTVAPLKGAAMSRATAAVGKAVGAVTGKAPPESKSTGNASSAQDKPPANHAPTPAPPSVPDVPPAGQDSHAVPSADTAGTAPAAPASTPTPAPPPEGAKEPVCSPVEPMPPLDDSVVCLDDVVPDIAIDAPQDPASSDLRPPVELIVIPPTPEPRSVSGRSSIDAGPPSPMGSPKAVDDRKNGSDQNVSVSTDDDHKPTGDAPTPLTAASPPPSHDAADHKGQSQPSPEQSVRDSNIAHNEASTDHPLPTAPERTPSPEARAFPAGKESPTSKAKEPSSPNHEQPLTPERDSSPVLGEPTGDHSVAEPKHPEPAGAQSPEPSHPESTPAQIPEPHDEKSDKSSGQPVSPSAPHDDITSPGRESPTRKSDSSSPAPRDSSPFSPAAKEATPVEPFVPPAIRRPSPAAPDIVLEGDLPEEFKGPHTPQQAGENGLLDDIEEPPKLMKISMDTNDLKEALEKGATAVADQLAQCLDNLALNPNHSEKEDISDRASPEQQAEIARKISQQMIDEAKTPFAAGLASTFVEGAEAAKKAATSAFEDLVDLANTVSETVVDGMKEAAEQVNDKMKAMQTRSSLVESGDGEDRPIKYEETDPIIDTVLESVASDSDRVDHAMNNVSAGMEAKENGKKEHEDDEGFRVAADSHDTRLYLPPPSAGRGRAPAVPHLSRPLFFELATVPHFNGKCSLPDEQSAIEYFTNIRSANYILHSEDISPVVLDGWLTGKKHWLNNGHKTRMIPTRHHSALQAFVTQNGPQLEEHGLVMNSSLEHNTISINTEEGREDYHMIKIEL